MRRRGWEEVDYIEPTKDYGLNPKQLAFVRKWIETGNGSQSYKEAYEVEHDATAEVNASRLLRNAKVRAYIDDVLAEAKNDLIADTREIMERLTRNARRLEMESVVSREVTKKVWYETGADGNQKRMEESKETPIVVQIPTPIGDANRALELLGKAHMLFVDRKKVDGVSRTVIVSDEDEMRRVMNERDENS